MNAQDDGLVKHWTFDANESDYLADVVGVGKPNVADGKRGYGVYLNGDNHYFAIRKIDVKEDFTLTFWIRPLNVERTQTVLLQEKINTKTGATDQYLQLGIQDKKLFLRNQNNYLGIQPMELKDGEWYFVSYSYDGFEAKIIVQGKEVYSTNKVTLYNEMYQRSDHLHIGKNLNGTAKFEGVLDEIRAHNLPLKKDKIVKVYEELAEPEVIEVEPPVIEEKDPVVVQQVIEEPKDEKPEDKHFKENFKNRKNKIQHQIFVTDPNIEVEVWDFDHYDEDRISITLNNSEFIGEQSRNRLLQKKRKKEIYKFNLVPATTNYLTFIAEDMGIYESQNTAAVRLIVNGKPFDDIYKLVLTQEENAVLKITHIPKNEEKQPIIPVADATPQATYKIVIDNEVLDPLVVSSTVVTLKIKTKNKESLNQKVKLSVDEKSLGEPFVINNFVAKEVTFNVNADQEKILLIEAFELLKDANCLAEATIIVNDKAVRTYNLRLDRNNVLLPLVYVPSPDDKKPSSERIVTVTDTNLIIQIKDNSKVDGDVVTITQKGKVILENYTLTGEYKDLNVQLKPNDKTTFFFKPISMGRSSGENTAYVMIVSKGEVIHEFSLRSQDKNKPAKLVIIHKDM